MIASERSQAGRQFIWRPFYLLMSIVLAGIVLDGFSHTVPQDLAPPGLPLLLKCHAVIFVAWVLLFIAQPSLILSGNVTLHRRLGWFGLALTGIMLGLGAAAIMFALRANALPPFYPPGLFISRGIIGLIGFATLIAFAIQERRRPEWHKRLILCAAIIVTGPGLERAMPVFLFGPHWYFIVDAVSLGLSLIGPAMDLIALRRIHPAYLYGVGTILLIQATSDLLAPTHFAATFAQFLSAT